MGTAWNVLVVDDEEDVHNITTVALRRKSWRDRPIVLCHAKSGAEARRLLEASDAPSFQCALVDVVMETDDAGLRLCDFIRSKMPRTTRIILRTGQPGAAPPDKVMNEYDIDYYMAKTEVTPERLFTTLRACFRSSLDIAALLAVGTQLRAFSLALQEVSTTQEGLLAIMRDSLRFLEDKYAARIAFVVRSSDAEAALAGAANAIETARRKEVAPMALSPGAELGLGEGAFVILTTRLVDRSEKTMGERLKRWFQNLASEPEPEEAASIVVKFERPPSEKVQTEFRQDLDLFVANWRIAISSLRLQDRLVRDRMEIVKNYGGPS